MSNKTNFYADGSTVYDAGDFRAPWADMLSNGIINGYNVTADSPADLAVSVQPGAANINGYISRDDSVVTIPIAANVSGYNRIDIIVVNIDDENCKTTIKDIEGVPSSTPVAPAAQDNQTELAKVLVGNNASVIDNNVITDERTMSELSMLSHSQYVKGTSLGLKSASDAPSTWPAGMYYSTVYRDGYPCEYGILLTIKDTLHFPAATQILTEWPRTDGGQTHMWIRGCRNIGADIWGPFSPVETANNNIGEIKMCAGAALPGTFLCDGSTFSATDFPLLASYLGSTTLPDMRGCAPGMAGGALGSTVGATVGSDTHTQSFTNPIAYTGNNPYTLQKDQYYKFLASDQTVGARIEHTVSRPANEMAEGNYEIHVINMSGSSIQRTYVCNFCIVHD